MKPFDMVAVGLAVAAAVSFLVVHFVRAGTRRNARAGCPGCAGAARGPAHSPHLDRPRGTGCPGCD